MAPPDYRQNTAVKILVIDFDAEKIASICSILKNHDYELMEGNSQEQMLEFLRHKYTFDLVITSIDIPNISPRKHIKKIRSSQSDIPIIITTNKKRLEALQECAGVGGDDYITLPVDQKKMLNAINRSLQLGKSRTIMKDELGGQMQNIIAEYQLMSVIGKGAMGMVYLAEKIHRGHRQAYAIKVLNPLDRQNESQVKEIIERFVREAETAMTLKHPNIVEIFECGLYENPEPQPYIVMELIQGESLRKYIDGEITISLLDKVNIILQSAEALLVIHQHNICHRDVKPENIMVTPSLEVKVTDFGFARIPNSELTQTLRVVGTPFYMAPEAYASSKVDRRADIFSLGVVAYELFLGRKPFAANTFSELRRQIQLARPRGPRKIDPLFPIELQRILANSLKKDPFSRYKSMKELIQELDEYREKISQPPKTEQICSLSTPDSAYATSFKVKTRIDHEYRFNVDWS